MAVTKVTVIYSPLHGVDFRMSFYVNGAVTDPLDTAIQAIITKLNAVTRAYGIELELTVMHNVAASPTAGAAYVSEDKGQFVFTDANGKAHNYKVPGIKAAILDGNKETINQAATGVPAYITAVTTYARGRGGADVTTLISATRRENRKRLKTAPQIA